MAATEAGAVAREYVSAYAAAAGEVVSAIPACDLSAPVSACPGWSAYDLVVHLGNVHAWAATILETGRRAAEQDDRPDSRRPRVVAQWYAGKAEDLLQVLRDSVPARECWTFSAHHDTAAFWSRRQAHETLVHLADLLAARGAVPAIAPTLAADGVAEVLEVFLPRMHTRGRPAAFTAPLVLETADTGDRWLLRASRDGGPPLVRPVAVEETLPAGLDRVRADAADLMLLLWRRLPPSHPGVRLGGDVTRVTAFLESPLTA